MASGNGHAHGGNGHGPELHALGDGRGAAGGHPLGAGGAVSLSGRPVQSTSAGTTSLFLTSRRRHARRRAPRRDEKDIIRSGLSMILCFLGLAGLYVGRRGDARGRRPGARLHRRHQRADPVRDHAHPVQVGARAARLPPPGGPAAIASVVLADLIALIVTATSGPHRPPDRATPRDDAGHAGLFTRLRAPFEVVERAAGWRSVIGGDLPCQARAGRPAVSHSLDAYLVLSGLLFASARSASSPGATRSPC